MRQAVHSLLYWLVIGVWSATSDGASLLGLLGFRWTPVIEISQGKLRGIAEETHNKYLGIPYATVQRRFLAPGDPPSWKDTFDAIEGRSCPQIFPFLQIRLGSEDCLILNVYTPKHASPKRPLPVMVFIHGGGYFFGGSSSLFYGAEPLVEKDVVLVTITYRLGALGFLCLGLEEAPGNAGLKDQLAALRWVKANINAFGGDPSSVTIFGESAGAASAHLLVLSKVAEGLYHRAILESNSALSPYSFSYDPIGKASNIAKRLGYETVDPRELLRIYQNATIDELLNAPNSDVESDKYSFRPCIEREFPGVEAVITESPHAILQAGTYNKVPMIIGYNDREGLFFVARLNDESLANLDANFETLLPEDLQFNTTEEKKAVAQAVRKFYLDDKPVSREYTDAMVDFTSDAIFHVSSIRSTELHLNTSNQPVFNYYFTYDSINNLGKLLSRASHQRGATHTDELYYLFQPSFRVYPLVGKDRIMADRMSQLWTNFAKTGDPTPSPPSPLLPAAWLASSGTGLQFYTLGDDARMRDPPNPRRVAFWMDLYDKYGIK